MLSFELISLFQIFSLGFFSSSIWNSIIESFGLSASFFIFHSLLLVFLSLFNSIFIFDIELFHRKIYAKPEHRLKAARKKDEKISIRTTFRIYFYCEWWHLSPHVSTNWTYISIYACASVVLNFVVILHAIWLKCIPLRGITNVLSCCLTFQSFRFTMISQ